MTKPAEYETATAAELLEHFRTLSGLALPAESYAPSALPTGRYMRVPFSALSLKNDKAFKHDNSYAWCHESKLKELRSIEIDLIGEAQDCQLCFIRIPPGIRFKIRGGGHRALLLSDKRAAAYVWFSGDVRLAQEAPSTFVLGEASFIADARIILLNCDCLIGHDSLWSDGILAQGSNQHGIVDLGQMAQIDYGRNKITLEPHVWIGRRAILCAGAHMGEGSILGTGALAAKPYPATAIVVGNPGRAIKTGMSWSFGLHRITEGEQRLLSALRRKILPDPPPSQVAADQTSERPPEALIPEVLVTGPGAELPAGEFGGGTLRPLPPLVSAPLRDNALRGLAVQGVVSVLCGMLGAFLYGLW